MGAENSKGYLLYYVERGDNLWSIAKEVFQLTSNAAIQAKVQELVRRNGHLKNPDHIGIGQVLALGPADAGVDNPPHAPDLIEIEKDLRIDPHQRSFVLDQFPVLQAIGKYADPNEPCRVPTSMNPHQLRASLPMAAGVQVAKESFSFTGKDAYRIGKAANNTGKAASAGKIGNLLSRSPFAWQELEGSIVRGIEKDIRYVSRANGTLQLVPKGARAFESGGRVLLVNPTNGGFYSYSKSVKLAKNVGKKLLEPAGKFFKIIDLGVYVHSVNEAMGTADQNRTIFQETGKYTAGLGMSLAAPGLALGVCSALTFSTGPGGVVCFFGVFLASSYGASAFGEAAGGVLYDVGDALYESTLRFRASF